MDIMIFSSQIRVLQGQRSRCVNVLLGSLEIWLARADLLLLLFSWIGRQF